MPTRRRADARRRGSHLRFQARTRSIVRHHRWIYTGIARHRELRMPRRSHSFVFSLGRATVRLLVRDDVASDSDDATRNQVNTHRARARVVARAPCLYARLRVRPLEPTSRRRELLVPRITSTSAEPPSRRRRRPSSTARSRRARADARPSDRDGDDDGNDDACVRPAARASSTATGKDTERPPPKLKQNKEKKEGGASDDSWVPTIRARREGRRGRCGANDACRRRDRAGRRARPTRDRRRTERREGVDRAFKRSVGRSLESRE